MKGAPALLFTVSIFFLLDMVRGVAHDCRELRRDKLILERLGLPEPDTDRVDFCESVGFKMRKYNR